MTFACVVCGSIVAASDVAGHRCDSTARSLRVLLVDPISADVVRLVPATAPERWTDVAFTDDPPRRSLTFAGAVLRQFARDGRVQPDDAVLDLVDAAHKDRSETKVGP